MKYTVFIFYNFDEPSHIKIMKYYPCLYQDFAELYEQADISFSQFLYDAPAIVKLLEDYCREYDISVDDFTGQFYVDSFSDYVSTGCSGRIGGDYHAPDKDQCCS